MPVNHPNPYWLQREEIILLVKESRAIIAKDPESLTDSPSPVADVVCNVARVGGYERLGALKDIVTQHITDVNVRLVALGIIDDFDNGFDAWRIGEVVEGVLADRVSRLALNEVGLHLLSSPRRKGK